MTEIKAGLPVIAFPDLAAFESWIETQGSSCAGLWVKFAKKNAATATLSKAEAIDAALCHGWIDGQLDKYDADHWLIRFTPRKARGKWSEKNRTRALELIATGRVKP